MTESLIPTCSQADREIWETTGKWNLFIFAQYDTMCTGLAPTVLPSVYANINKQKWVDYQKIAGCAKICLVFDKKSAQRTFLPLLKIFVRSECINQGVLSVVNHTYKIWSAYHPALQITTFILFFKFKLIGGYHFIVSTKPSMYTKW